MLEQSVLSLKLANACELVLGAERAAIYNLENGDVYSINEAARDILLGRRLDEIYWNKLKELDLAEPTDYSSPAVEIQVPQVGLEFMWLELTGRCNEKCLHCYTSAGETLSQIDELNSTSWEQIIEEGAALNCKELQFIGGEPLLSKAIFDLAAVAKDLNYTLVEIFTNGLLIDEKAIKKIKDLGLHVAVSLYSVVPEVHDAITQVPGSFHKTFRALEMLKEAAIPTRVSVIVMRQNQDTISETLTRLKEMDLDINGVDIVRSSGRGGCNDLLPSTEIARTWSLITKPNFYADKETFYRNKYWNNCWAGKIAITSKGLVIPCVFARNHVVSDIKEGLEKAINSKELQNLWRITKDKIETCVDCEYQYACHDCRPLAESVTGNLYAKNPRCAYNPYKGEWD